MRVSHLKKPSSPAPFNVALLRGINVGRAKRVPMAELRDLFTELGYTDVLTLLNSGNVIFRAPRLTAASEKHIEDAFTAKFGFTSRITLVTAAELREIVSEDPIGATATDHSRFMVMVLKRPLHREKLLPLLQEDWLPDMLGVGKRVAYLWCPAGILESRLANAAGRILGEDVTTRNWATILKLHKLVSND